MKEKSSGAPVTFKGILLATTRLGYVIGNHTECQEYYFTKKDIRSVWFNKDVDGGIEIEIPYHIAKEKGVSV